MQVYIVKWLADEQETVIAGVYDKRKKADDRRREIIETERVSHWDVEVEGHIVQ